MLSSATRYHPQSSEIALYDANAFAAMRRAGRLAAETLDMLIEHVHPGITTAKLDDLAFAFARDHQALPAPLNYRGFPKAICTSVNHVICHGIPGDRKLVEGDIVNIDVTLIVDGWHGDSSRMYAVGAISHKAKRLINTAYEAMNRGIKAVRPGARLGDLGHAIQSYVEAQRFSVVRDFCGHGLGQHFHGEPNIHHYGIPGHGLPIAEGMFFTIEPMINVGKPDAKLLRDGWTAVTRDKSLSAQFEHSLGVTAEGCEIFTLSPTGCHIP